MSHEGQEDARRTAERPAGVGLGLVLGSLTLLGACADTEPSPGASPVIGSGEVSTGDATDAAGDVAERASANVLRADPRVSWLYAPCARSAPFLEDTSDWVSVQVEKLVHGERDPSRRAKLELAGAGVAARRHLERLIEEAFDDTMKAPALSNVIDVLTRSSEPYARELLLGLLDYPSETVLAATVRGLQEHAQPEDYDVLFALLHTRQTQAAQFDCLSAMGRADSERLLRLFVRWTDTEQNEFHWVGLSRYFLERDPAALGEAFRARWRDFEPAVRPFLAAAVAGSGGEEAELAQSYLSSHVQAEDLSLRLATIEALRLAERWDDLAAFAGDPDGGARGLVYASLAAGAPPDLRIDVLQGGLSDPDDRVRRAALGGLVSAGFEPAIADAIHGLGLDVLARRDAIEALRQRMPLDPALAERVRERLLMLLEKHRDSPWNERSTLIKAIGQVPGADSARILLSPEESGYAELVQPPDDGERLGASALEGGRSALGPARFLTQQAGNAGPEARTWMQERWRAEADPLERMNLLEAIAFGLDASTHDFLLAALIDPRLEPEERVQIGDKLTSRGPSHRVAPVLKRVALREEDPETRRALNCLLWRWYGR